MNNLGLAAFDANGATLGASWPSPSIRMVTRFRLSPRCQYCDGSYDSQLLIDYIKEKNFSIESVKLKDIDDVDLKFLSVGDSNPYFHGINPIHEQLR